MISYEATRAEMIRAITRPITGLFKTRAGPLQKVPLIGCNRAPRKGPSKNSEQPRQATSWPREAVSAAACRQNLKIASTAAGFEFRVRVFGPTLRIQKERAPFRRKGLAGLRPLLTP